LSVEKVKQEIIDWHQFLHHFFRGEIEATEFSRMERVLTPEFNYVTVWGDVANREEFLGVNLVSSDLYRPNQAAEGR